MSTSDILIRDVPESTVAEIDRRAGDLGISRNEYLRRWLDTGMRPAQQVTPEDEELLLISAHGQVIRTETNTINRYSPSARGVIVMRLAEEDRVVAIAAFRPGLADRGAMGDNGDPQPDGGGSDGQGQGRTS